MSTINKQFLDIKRLELEVEHSKSEVFNIKNELLLEEKNLSALEKDHEMVKLQNSANEKLLTVKRETTAKTKAFSRISQKNQLWHAILAQFIDTASPVKEEQINQLNKVHGQYASMLEFYEARETYQKIVQDMAEEQKLTELIAQRRSELMALESEYNSPKM